MKISQGGLTAECEINSESEVRARMSCILENVVREHKPSHVIIIDTTDKVYYEIIDGFERKSEIPL